MTDEPLREALELLRAMSSLMHNLAGDTVGHTSFDWRKCTQPLCLRVRAALTATPAHWHERAPGPLDSCPVCGYPVAPTPDSPHGRAAATEDTE